MKNVFLAAAAIVVLSGSISIAAPRHPPKTIVTLWDQNANFGTGVNSQNYESAMATYDDIAADDFVVPADHKWFISEVDVTGAYVGGSGPATSVEVGFWLSKVKGDAYPKHLKYSYTLTCTDNAGSFACALPSEAGGKPVVRLAAGTFWLTVVANCDSTVCGQWQWTENTSVQGSQAEWANAGNGWGIIRCDLWNWLNDCFGGSPADLAFTLKGYSVL
jgi:hypothetical protein